MKYIFILLIFLGNSLFCQIDTSICYPLKVGNYWEYEGINWHENRVETIYKWVTGDTVLHNGKKYFILVQSHKTNSQIKDTIFQRVEDNKYVYQFDKWCQSNNYEQLFFDFGASDLTFWDLYCGFDSYNSDFFSGIEKTYYDYFSLFPFPIQVKSFTNVEIGDLWEDGTIDTTWNPLSSWGNVWIGKGIGIISELAELGLHWDLTGAIINDKSYGIITHVDADQKFIYEKLTIAATPNPFNGSTKIIINSPESEHTNIDLYDILGRKIKNIVSNVRLQGTHAFMLTQDNLATGIYFVVVQNKKDIISHKIVHLK